MVLISSTMFGNHSVRLLDSLMLQLSWNKLIKGAFYSAMKNTQNWSSLGSFNPPELTCFLRLRQVHVWKGRSSVRLHVSMRHFKGFWFTTEHKNAIVVCKIFLFTGWRCESWNKSIYEHCEFRSALTMIGSCTAALVVCAKCKCSKCSHMWSS